MCNAVRRLFLPCGLLCQMSMSVVCLALLTASSIAQPQQLVTGKKITPVGTNTQVGNLPMNVIKSPNGKYAIISDMGYNQWLSSPCVRRWRT